MQKMINVSYHPCEKEMISAVMIMETNEIKFGIF